MVLLRVSYRMRAHHIQEFERVFDSSIVPVIEEHDLKFLGYWKVLVGEVGEFMELWSFDSVADFETGWKSLIEDARIQEIFKTTGPMVEEENWTLLEPAGRGQWKLGL